MKTLINVNIISALMLLFVSSFSYASDEVYTGFFNNKALSGYDSVAYFTENAPVKGLAEFKTEYKEADWYFSSQENLQAFIANPEKYAPQYGGYCAWAISEKNDFAPGDPEQWSLVDGKLYLNYNEDIKNKWESDRTQHITQANQNWPSLIQ